MKLKKRIWIIGLIFSILTILPAATAIAAPPKQGELAIIASPADNEVVRGVVSITGSAVHPSFQRYEVSFAAEPVTSNEQWVLISDARTEQIVNGELVAWDTNTVPDGSYSLRLRVVRLDGNYGEIEVQHIVVANAQPTETPTPSASATPTVTPTPLPPTPTIIIEAPVDTPTPRPLTVTETLPTPNPGDTGLIPIPKVELDTSPLKSSCLLGAGGILIIFVFFGFLSAIRLLVLGFAKRGKRRRRK